MMNNRKFRLPDNCGFKWEDGFLLDEKGNEVCNFYTEVVTCYNIPLNGNCSYKIRFHIGKENFVVEKILSLEELQKYNYLNVSNQCMLGINIPANQIRRNLFYLIQRQILGLGLEKDGMTNEQKLLIDTLACALTGKGYTVPELR